VPNVGGSIATAGGLIFIAATQDRFLRADDICTGKERWRAELPAAEMATPMIYRSKCTGRQYVLVAAGGHLSISGPTEASFQAFALPTPAGG
jgi:glucose dehydrogenase